jgi:hypothetical protein
MPEQRGDLTGDGVPALAVVFWIVMRAHMAPRQTTAELDATTSDVGRCTLDIAGDDQDRTLFAVGHTLCTLQRSTRRRERSGSLAYGAPERPPYLASQLTPRLWRAPDDTLRAWCTNSLRTHAVA